MPIRQIISAKSILPVVTFTQKEHVLPVVDALLAGDIRQIEVTLRSEAALAALELIAQKRPEMTLAAGTINNEAQLQQAIDAGAQFGVSPGFDPALAARALSLNFPYLPGVATASEVMLAIKHGYDVLKVFPMKALGGLTLLRSFAGPFPNVLFCPSGGISADTAKEYFSLPNVYSLGGSWLVTATDCADKNWSAITARARATNQQL